MRAGNSRIKRFIAVILSIIVCISVFYMPVIAVSPPQIGSSSAILMEASSGKVIYEKNSEERRSPASITKIMTLILIFDALKDGSLKLDEEVTTSAHAKSMGGSQVFLEEGEQQTVDTLIKCIVISSGNDACVAMAERLGGTEAAFVDMMNKRAKGLGMNKTNFVDCCGLTDSKKHLTTAKDIAIMSKELITRYPEITKYTTIWMDKITHKTKKGESEFGLSNTNKMLKMTTGFEVTGLKTGSTSTAGCCFSGTGRKDGINLIAVVLNAPDYKVRFVEAKNLLDYGFTLCKRYKDKNISELKDIKVKMGKKNTLKLKYGKEPDIIRLDGKDFTNIKKKIRIKSKIEAPLKQDEKIGSLVYFDGENEIGKRDILAAENIKKAEYKDYLISMWKIFILS